MNHALRIIAVTVAMFFVGGIVPTHAAEKKLVQTKQYVDEVKDGQKCKPVNDATMPNPKGKSVAPLLRRGYEAWKDVPAEKKTITFADPTDPKTKTVELSVSSTQYCDPQTRVYKIVQGFPGVFTRDSAFRYCTCTKPAEPLVSATVRLVPDLKYDRKSHIICEGDFKCPDRPKSAPKKK